MDTNFLIDAVRFKIDLREIDELIGKSEIVTLNSVERELNIIAKRTSKVGMCARTALDLIKKQEIKILKSDERPDSAVLKINDKTIVATNDSELRKRLKTLHRKTIYLKSKKHLAIS